MALSEFEVLDSRPRGSDIYRAVRVELGPVAAPHAGESA